MERKTVGGYVLEVPWTKPNEELLAYTYLRFQQEKLLDVIFYEKWPVFPIRDFLDWCQKINILGCYVQGPGLDRTLAGIGIVERISQTGYFRRMAIGVGFFREYQRHGIPEAFCDELEDWCFIEAQANVIYGVTPEHNKSMIRFARRMRFHEETLRLSASWKGQPVTGHIFSRTEAEWKCRRAGIPLGGF